MSDDAWPDGSWPKDDALVAETRAFAAAWHGDRAGLAACLGTRALVDDRSVAVVAGQQPAVGGGPLYTLVKAAHACALAAYLRRLGVPAVPVFWCASEDHDLGEADHADLVLADGRLRRVRADLGPGRASLRFRPAALWWEALVAACRSDLRGDLGRAWLMERRPVAEDLGAWLCRLLGELFRDHGLVCVEAHRLRPLWRDAWPRIAAAWPAALLEEHRRRLLAAGHADAFGSLIIPPLFVDEATGRTPLDPAALPDLIGAGSDAISPGAALRPVLQQLALPAALAVTGPGEIAYHRFLAPLYAALGASRPRLVLRCSATLVPSWHARAVERWGSTVAALMEGAAAPVDVPAPALTDLDAALAGLHAAVEQGPADGRQRVLAGLARLGRERDRLAASLARAHRQRDGRLAWGTLASWVHPRGQPQDRVMSLFQALWEHGPGIAARLVAEAGAVGPGAMAVVRLDA